LPTLLAMKVPIYFSDHLYVDRYGRSRFWAVYLDGELLAVTVYRKGAVAICEVLMDCRS